MAKKLVEEIKPDVIETVNTEIVEVAIVETVAKPKGIKGGSR